MVSTSNLQTPLMSDVLPNGNRYAVGFCVFSPHHSNLTDLGGEQPSLTVRDPAPHYSFDSAMHASASSTQTNSDESYDSVG
jgi:hypothetical protein